MLEVLGLPHLPIGELQGIRIDTRQDGYDWYFRSRVVRSEGLAAYRSFPIPFTFEFGVGPKMGMSDEEDGSIRDEHGTFFIAKL